LEKGGIDLFPAVCGVKQWPVNPGRTIFSQLLQHRPEKEFQKCVAGYKGDSNLRGLSCRDQLLAMAFAQLTYRESLRDIEPCLRALQSKLDHRGFRAGVSRSTLADANESHDSRIFAEFAQALIGIARPLHAQHPIGVDLDQSLCALDSTTIDLCLSLFPWAKFRQRKAAVKMHTLLDLHGNIPHIHPRQQSRCARCQHPGRDHAGSRIVLPWIRKGVPRHLKRHY
jgi:Domain of unknown function (DUF4372)